MTPLEQARALRDRGLSVFPIPLGSKVPTLLWKAYQDRLATDEELVAWFGDGQPTNMGIVTGAVSGVVVVDADTPQAVYYAVRHLPYTPWQTGTARGCHLWFAHPGFPVANRGTDVPTSKGPLPIHLRADHGYVLAPHSVHPSGARYRACGNWAAPRTELPRFWPGWLTRPVRPTRSAPIAPLRETFLLERARRYLRSIPLPQIGHGSDTAVFSAACRLVRGFGLSSSDATSLLWEWCGNRDGWTAAWVSEKVANAERHGAEAMGGLR